MKRIIELDEEDIKKLISEKYGVNPKDIAKNLTVLIIKMTVSLYLSLRRRIMAKSKKEILLQIKDVDDRLLLFCDKKLKLNPLKLKKVELERLLDAFETIEELFRKCSDTKGE